MPYDTINGVGLYWQQTGEARDPLVFVHGSWTDHHTWDMVVPFLANSFRVLTYDRRGHSRSQRPAGPGSIREDVADLAALLERTGSAPAHLVGGSLGGSIVLRLAAERPELCRSLVAHEPPLFRLLDQDPDASDALETVREHTDQVLQMLAAGDPLAGARYFIEAIALGPGAWSQLPAAMREILVFNAPTFADEAADPESFELDLSALKSVSCPVLLTMGENSPSYFGMVVSKIVDALPRARTRLFAGAGHVPHVSHPGEFAKAVREFAQR